MDTKFIVVHHFNNYCAARSADKSIGKIWVPVSRYNRRYGNAANVSMFSQPLIDFCKKHDIGFSVVDVHDNVVERFAGKA